VHACTIAPRSHLAHVRVLAESVKAFHPMSRFTVLVIDGEPGDRYDEDTPADVLVPAETGIDADELHRLALIHDADELCAALTPVLLAHLLDDGDDVVVYLDRASLLYGDLDAVEPMARRHGVVLLPQVVHLPSRAGPATDTFTEQLSGLDDLGFVAVTAAARPFLRWWREHLATERDLDPSAPITEVPRWFELLPGPFDHEVWRDPGVGVAYWNLHDRPLTRSPAGRVLAGAVPLRWMRFYGYDVDQPYLLSPVQGSTPESRLSLQPTLAEVTADYHERLRAGGVERWSTEGYRYGTVNGGPLPRSIRRLAATALSERSMFDPPPSPFGPDGSAAFVAWLNQPWAWRDDRTVTLLLIHVWSQRPDVQAAYRDPINVDTAGLAEWGERAADYIEQWGHLHDPPREAPADAGAGAGRRPAPLPGLNIVGYLRGELGLGEAGRRMAMAADAAGVPHQTVSYGFVPARQLDPFAAHADIADSVAPYAVNLLCVNAGSTTHLVANLPPALRRDRYNIGLWFWETDRPEPGTPAALELVDEVWVTSDYLAEILRAHTDKPVLVAPLAVPTPAPTRLERRDLRLPPDRQIYLAVFDVFSSVGRKNPMGVLNAYCQAFAPDDGAHLVVKSINGARRPELLERMWYATRHRPDIEIRDGYVSRSEMNALVQLSDVYVSLHRSEGFGLNLAAAMASGKPVIATNYSGNLAFMNEENSLLVPYTMTDVGPGNPPYPPGDRWAEPDLDAAAAQMAKLLANPEAAQAIGERARRDIARTHGPDVAGAWVARRLDRYPART
jgi:glycosyltransferase involved in cell wall biosynthesis